MLCAVLKRACHLEANLAALLVEYLMNLPRNNQEYFNRIKKKGGNKHDGF